MLIAALLAAVLHRLNDANDRLRLVQQDVRHGECADL